MQTAFAVAFSNTERKSELPFVGAILPNKPPIDKVAAYELVGMHCAQRLSAVNFHDTNEFADEEIQQWEKDGILPIDVGGRKYHGQAGSATEWVVKRYCLPRTKGVEELLELINDNNGNEKNKGGFLKGYAFSVPGLIRKLYELKDEETWHAEVVWAAGDVVNAFVKVANGDVVPQHEPPDGDIILLAKEFAQDKEKPLTLGQYVANLWSLGESSDVIVEKLAFWQDALRRLNEIYAWAKAEWRQLQGDKQKLSRLEFKAGKHRGIILRTDNRALVNVVTREGHYAIRLIVSSDGHTTIATNRLDIAKLNEAFAEREPERWHYNRDMGALLNGGPQYTGVKPTRIPGDEIITQLKMLFKPVP